MLDDSDLPVAIAVPFPIVSNIEVPFKVGILLVAVGSACAVDYQFECIVRRRIVPGAYRESGTAFGPVKVWLGETPITFEMEFRYEPTRGIPAMSPKSG